MSVGGLKYTGVCNVVMLLTVFLSYLILGLPRFQGLAAFRTIFLHSTRSCAIRSTLSALRPVHSVILSIQLLRGLPVLLLPGTLPCITVFFKLFCDLTICPAYVSFLLLILVRSS